MIEPRLGTYEPENDAAKGADARAGARSCPPTESRGLRFARFTGCSGSSSCSLC